MLLYAIIMLLVALPIAVISIRIYRGHTELIHDYHQKKVTDKAAYGRAFGKALGGMALSAFASGIAALFESMSLAMGLLCIGFVGSIIDMLVVQKRYNQGLF